MMRERLPAAGLQCSVKWPMISSQILPVAHKRKFPMAPKCNGFDLSTCLRVLFFRRAWYLVCARYWFFFVRLPLLRIWTIADNDAWKIYWKRTKIHILIPETKMLRSRAKNMARLEQYVGERIYWKYWFDFGLTENFGDSLRIGGAHCINWRSAQYGRKMQHTHSSGIMGI